MGLLIDGRWHDQWYDTSATGGRFVRRDSVFAIGLRLTVRPARRGPADTGPSPVAIISMFRWHAPGRIGP